MVAGQIAGSVLFLALAIGSFVISYFQWKEKGYLLNNAYFWASQEERREMDENRGSKRLRYRQSGIAFMLVGLICLLSAGYIATGWMWLLAAFWLAVITAVVYAVVSSVQIERRKQK